MAAFAAEAAIVAGIILTRKKEFPSHVSAVNLFANMVSFSVIIHLIPNITLMAGSVLGGFVVMACPTIIWALITFFRS
jgi:hypothetical protein